MKTSLLTELRKHAAYSEALRTASVDKTAGLAGALLRPLWSGAKKVGLMAARNPGKTLTLGAGTMQAAAAAKAARPQFDQGIQRAQLGIGPDGLPLRGQ